MEVKSFIDIKLRINYESYFHFNFYIYLYHNFEFTSYGLDKSPAIDNRYFGETPPSLIPKPFTPSIPSVGGEFESGIFSPDMQEFYFTTLIGKEKKRASFVVYYENNQWGEAIKTDFKWPMFSVDGTKMYIGKSYRDKTGWSEP